MTSTTSKHHSNAEASGVYARGVVTPSPEKEQHKNKPKTRETEKNGEKSRKLTKNYHNTVYKCPSCQYMR